MQSSPVAAAGAGERVGVTPGALNTAPVKVETLDQQPYEYNHETEACNRCECHQAEYRVEYSIKSQEQHPHQHQHQHQHQHHPHHVQHQQPQRTPVQPYVSMTTGEETTRSSCSNSSHTHASPDANSASPRFSTHGNGVSTFHNRPANATRSR
ncbi:hypothetical protein BGZ94_004785, partial [Podila epigama]